MSAMKLSSWVALAAFEAPFAIRRARPRVACFRRGALSMCR
jgi:hypothetical protein